MTRAARPLLFAACLVVGLVSMAHEATAYRDCCFARSVPPRLVGMTFYGSIDSVLDGLDRAGFGDYDPGRRRIDGLGTFADTPGPDEPYAPGVLSTRRFAPSFVTWELACGPPRTVMESTMGGHPNGARMLVAVIAITDDLDRTCQELDGERSRAWTTARFGPEQEDVSLGARVREAHLAFGAMRIIAPQDPKGVAARWLAQGGPRWMGFRVEVDDLDETARWLQRETVPFERSCISMIRIQPDALDGLLVEFVPRRYRESGNKCQGYFAPPSSMVGLVR